MSLNNCKHLKTTIYHLKNLIKVTFKANQNNKKRTKDLRNKLLLIVNDLAAIVCDFWQAVWPLKYESLK